MKHYTLKEKIEMIKDMHNNMDEVPEDRKQECLGFNDAIWKVLMILDINKA